MLENVGQTRRPNDWDRQNLKQWRGWGFTDEMILEACTFAVGKSSPVVYVNSVLSSWKNKGIYTVEDARNNKKAPDFSQKQGVHFKNEREYTKEELDALITDVDDIDI